MSQGRVKLIREGIPRAVGPVSFRGATLNDESADDPVENDTVIKGAGLRFPVFKVQPGLGSRSKTHEVCHGHGRFFMKKATFEGSEIGLDGGKETLCFLRNPRQI